MPEWHGFAGMECPTEPGRTPLRAAADYAGTDDSPRPLVVLLQGKPGGMTGDDMVDLSEAELRWLVDEVAPMVLRRMGERP